MMGKTFSPRPRTNSLSRDRIIAASIALLDEHGETGLTFRGLAKKLSTGAGAIYWHVANKGELLGAACDAIVAPALKAPQAGTAPEASIRDLALKLFDAIDDHPWVGAALMHAPGQLPAVRILESLGRSIGALGVPDADRWSTVGALLNYVFGVAGRNASNRQFARAQGVNRSDFLKSVSISWLQLDPQTYPFTRSLAADVCAHDDREDFLSGIDLILSGIKKLADKLQ